MAPAENQWSIQVGTLLGAIVMSLVPIACLWAQDTVVGPTQRQIFFSDAEFWRACDSIWSAAAREFGEENAVPYLDRGQFLRRRSQELEAQGKLAEAKLLSDRSFEDFNTAILLEPKFHVSYLNRGNVYFDRGENEKALDDYTKVIKLAGEINAKNKDLVASAYSNRGAIHSRMEKPKKAMADFSEALKLNSKDPNTWNNRAVTHFEMEQYPEAIHDFTEFLTFHPNSGSSINARGVCYMRLGKWSESMIDFNQAIQLQPENGLFYSNRAIAQSKLGHKSAALADAEKARTLGQRVDPEFLQSLKK